MSEGHAGLAENPQINGQTMLRLLILEESASEAQALIDPLREAGYAVTAARVKSPLEFQVALKKQEWDLVLVPVQLPSFSAAQAVALVKHAKLDLPLIVVRDDYSDTEVVEALQSGARAVVKKRNFAHLQLVIDRELRDLAARRARHYYERMFRESERRCHTLLEGSHDAIACIRAGKIIYSNPTFNALVAPAGDDGVPSLSTLVHPDDRQALGDLIKRINHEIATKDRMRLRVRGADGREFETMVEASFAHLNGQQCVQLNIALSAAPAVAPTTAPAAANDAHGVVSPAGLLGALDTLLQTDKRPPLAVAYIELDGFQTLLGRVGPEQAERIAADIAVLILKAVGPQARLSRHSSHTLSLVLPAVEAAPAAQLAATLCREIAALSWRHHDQDVGITCSIGICVPGPAIKQGIAALAEADQACQLAKQAGGNRMVIADPERDAVPADQALAARQRIRDALAANRFRMVYQPIVNLHAQPFECYDVLMRMLGEGGQDVLPADFMPAAEQAGLMTALDRWVIHAALRTLAEQRAHGKETSFILKLSEDSLNDATLLSWLDTQLQELQVPGDMVMFEIKEAYATRNPAGIKQFIHGLKHLRCRAVLAHFGTDPHSLEHLEQLRVDFVKLAGSFIDKLPGDSRAELQIKTLVQAAHDMGTLTIATFVQEASKMTALWQCNVDYIQGYFLQAPEHELSYNFQAND